MKGFERSELRMGKVGWLKIVIWKVSAVQSEESRAEMQIGN